MAAENRKQLLVTVQSSNNKYLHSSNRSWSIGVLVRRVNEFLSHWKYTDRSVITLIINENAYQIVGITSTILNIPKRLGKIEYFQSPDLKCFWCRHSAIIYNMSWEYISDEISYAKQLVNFCTQWNVFELFYRIPVSRKLPLTYVPNWLPKLVLTHAVRDGALERLERDLYEIN